MKVKVSDCESSEGNEDHYFGNYRKGILRYKMAENVAKLALYIGVDSRIYK